MGSHQNVRSGLRRGRQRLARALGIRWPVFPPPSCHGAQRQSCTGGKRTTPAANGRGARVASRGLGGPNVRVLGGPAPLPVTAETACEFMESLLRVKTCAG